MVLHRAPGRGAGDDRVQHYLIFGAIGWGSAALGFLTGWLLVPRGPRCQDPHDITEWAEWDHHVMESLGGIWDPHAGRYIYPEREQPE